MKYLLSIIGPTAVGKTSLSLFLAKEFETEILSCDSRQMYAEMNIGTAKPTLAEMDGVPHHFIDTLKVGDVYNAGKFEEEAEALLTRLFHKHNVVIAVGGSTLYVDALWNGMDEMPAIPVGIREKLNAEFNATGLAPLLKELAEVDPQTFEVIDKKNQVRIIRALEVFRATGQPISFFRKGKKEKKRDYTLIKIGLQLEREELYNRINMRVDEMMKSGLEQEVRDLLGKGATPEMSSMNSIGYRELVPYIQGEIDLNRAVELIRRNSRRYAKRQMTWYQRYSDIKWFPAGADKAVGEWLKKLFK